MKNKCLKYGWIELNHFIKKYYNVETETALRYKRDAIMKSIGKFERCSIERVGSATVVHERAFCIFRHIAYKERG